MQGEVHWQYRRRFAVLWNELSVMREMAEDGWELCAIWFCWLYFKRPTGT